MTFLTRWFAAQRTITMLRKALAESVGQSAERHALVLDLMAENAALRGAHANLGQVVELHAMQCPCDTDERLALRRSYVSTLTNHGLFPRSMGVVQ